MPRPDGEDPQLQVSEILQNRNRFNRPGDAAADQDLAILGLGTEPGGEVAHRADRGVAGAFRTPIWPRVA